MQIVGKYSEVCDCRHVFGSHHMKVFHILSSIQGAYLRDESNIFSQLPLELLQMKRHYHAAMLPKVTNTLFISQLISCHLPTKLLVLVEFQECRYIE